MQRPRGCGIWKPLEAQNGDPGDWQSGSDCSTLPLPPPGRTPGLVSPLPTLVLQVLPPPPLLPRPRPCLTVSRQATLRNHSPNGQWALPWQEIGSSLVTPS